MPRTLSIQSAAFDSSLFHPVKLSGTESLNCLFNYQFILKTPDVDPIAFFKQFGVSLPHANIDLTAWLGKSICLGIELDGKDIGFSEVNNTIKQSYKKNVGKGVRYIHAVVTAAQYLYDQGRSSYYSVELRPFLSAAELKSNYKIYQDLTVIEILDQLLTAYPGTVVKRLDEEAENRYPKRDYQTQYGETDLAFFERLCSEWGINYWFEHHVDGHHLVLSDEISGHQDCASEAYHSIAYYPPNHKISEEYLHEFNMVAKMVSGAYASADYDYASASSEILDAQHNTQPYPDAGKGKSGSNESESESPEIANKAHEVYEYASDVSQPQAGPNQEGNDSTGELALRQKWQLERQQRHHFTATARGNIRGLAPSYKFSLRKHPAQSANIEWVIESSELLITDLAEESQRKQSGLPSLLTGLDSDSTLSELAMNHLTTDQKWFVDTKLTLVPSTVPVRPPKHAKPRGSLQTAIVVGEAESNSIYTDSFGRIKVQFHWDRYGAKDQNSSCWIRVNEPWAGNQLGAVFTPRMGQEVLIDFINNDPDLPVCIGKVNNSDNMPNWQLSQNQALSGFRSRELPEGNSGSGRSNHLVFDDTEGKIQTQMKSDHAHSQLSLGDITRIEDNAGRKDARGQGFELRTDDWGSARAAKGLYLTTFAREGAASTHMDAYEAEQLLAEAKQLVKQLSKLANQHEADPLSGTDPLDVFSKIAKSELPTHPDLKGAGIAGGEFNGAADALSGGMGALSSLGGINKQIDELNTLKSVLPNGLPNEVKAKATENVLKQLATQTAIPPIEPINPLADSTLRHANNIGDLQLHYDAEVKQYKDALKQYENNPYDQAKNKLKELDSTTKNPKERAEKLLKDKGVNSILSNMKANGKGYEQLQQETDSFSPKGFEENVLIGAAEAGIALVTPKDTHQYSAQKHTITTGQDVNVTTGNSWLASINNKLSFFVQQGIKIFSGKGKVQIQANRNNVEIVADKTVKIISANDKVETIAAKEILLTSGGAYIRIKDGNIEFHAPGKIEKKGATHPFAGPTSLSKSLPVLPNMETRQQEYFTLVDQSGILIPDQNYKITLDDGRIITGKTNIKGETALVKSNSWQVAEFIAMNNVNSEHIISYKSRLLSKKVKIEDFNYELIQSNDDIRWGLPPPLENNNLWRNMAFDSDLSRYNWGIRAYNVTKEGRYYRIIDGFTRKIIESFKMFNWNRVGDADIRSLMERIYPIVFQGEFGIPRNMWPKTEKAFYQKNSKILGSFSNAEWKLKINQDLLSEISHAYGVAYDQKKFQKLLKSLAKIICHELRHCQQNFWESVYAYRNQKQWVRVKYTKNLAWDYYVSHFSINPRLVTEIKRKAIPKTGNYVGISLQYFFLSSYIINFARMPAIYKEELPYVKNGLRMAVDNVEKMVTDKGYRLRPKEQDSFQCHRKAEEYYDENAKFFQHPKI